MRLASLMQTARHIYRRIFSLSEIEESRILQLGFAASLFLFFATFFNWNINQSLTVESYLANNYLCWPYFKSCGEFYFLHALPNGYSQTIWYAVLLGILILSA